jgi:hypothetical protein
MALAYRNILWPIEFDDANFLLAVQTQRHWCARLEESCSY